ncbi:MAG: Nif3-like dinuclear metal center hexameric protein [Candidatus Thorarchaeota archaeon]
MHTVREVVKYLRQIAPVELTVGGLTDRLEIGPQTETEQSNTAVRRIMITSYPSSRNVARASQEKANLMITAFPLFPRPVDRLAEHDLLRVRLLSKNYISSYYIGTAFVSARDGLSDALAERLGASVVRNFGVEGDYRTDVPIGRICRLEDEMNHSLFADRVMAKLGIEQVIFSGNLDDNVGEFLVVAGIQLGVTEILGAAESDLRTIITGDLAPDARTFAHERGISTLEVGSVTTTEPGMKRLRYQMSLEFKDISVEFVESQPVYKTLVSPSRM